jgi:MoaA/NifB/PqqE/SkfB family radical SAM enzyme
MFSPFKCLFNAKSLICKAPWVSMSISMDGTISPCCYTINTDRNNANAKWGRRKISDIWEGDVFQMYRKRIKAGVLPDACSICRDKIFAQEFKSLKTQEYERFNCKTKTPLIIELSVDNVCNLECIMCNSINSSKIANAKGARFKGIDDYDQLFEELKAFIPRVEEMIFTGGEPFLSKFYFRIWDEIIKTNPECKITLNTNCTVLNNESKEIIERGNFRFNVSIDSFKKENYELIRKNANFETVYANFEYLVDYSKRKAVPLAVAVCPLIYNYKDIPELINVCNQHHAYVHFVHVFGAQNSSLSLSDINTLDVALDFLTLHNPPSGNEIEQHNFDQYKSLIKDVRQWKVNNTVLQNALSEINNAKERARFETNFETLKENLDDNRQKKIISVIDCLSGNYKINILLDEINAIPNSVLEEYLDVLPIDEIAEYFTILIREAILTKYS